MRLPGERWKRSGRPFQIARAARLGRVWERVAEEGGICTDAWAAYPGAIPNVSHRWANRKTNFQDPITGVRKNDVEGIRGEMKNDGRRQCARLSRRSVSASNEGAFLFLDLVAWRANSRLKADRGGRKPGYLARFLLDLKALWEERREEVSVTTEGTGEPL